MAFRFRKTINLGNGIRINLSKSGVGYSWGIPGYRHTISSTGRHRKTYSIPGTGLSYVKESSPKKNIKNITINDDSLCRTDSGTLYDAKDYSIMEKIESSGISSMRPVEYKKLLNQITLRLFCDKLATLMILVALLYFLYEPYILFLIISILGVMAKCLLRIFFRIRVDYYFDGDYRELYNNYVNAWKKIAKSQRVWQIPLKASIRNKKNMYGAIQALERISLHIRFKTPWYLKSDINVPVLKFKRSSLILFPEKVLVVKKIRAGALSNNEVSFKFFNNGFIENDIKPKDSIFIQYQWLHPNKNGGPDKRFKDNEQLPVYLYGFIDISSSSGLNQRIMVTNGKLCDNLADEYKKFRKNFNFK